MSVSNGCRGESDAAHRWELPNATPQRIRLASVVKIGTSVGRVVQNLQHARARGRHRGDLMAFNGKGGRGVAYNATLRGYNLLAPGASSVANMAAALGSDPVSADNDLFNASFDANPIALPTFSGVSQAITITTYTLRGGLGAAMATGIS
jgi:hypothetical protein